MHFYMDVTAIEKKEIQINALFIEIECHKV